MAKLFINDSSSHFDRMFIDGEVRLRDPVTCLSHEQQQKYRKNCFFLTKERNIGHVSRLLQSPCHFPATSNVTVHSMTVRKGCNMCDRFAEMRERTNEWNNISLATTLLYKANECHPIGVYYHCCFRFMCINRIKENKNNSNMTFENNFLSYFNHFHWCVLCM